jgi:hypothetical protein
MNTMDGAEPDRLIAKLAADVEDLVDLTLWRFVDNDWLVALTYEANPLPPNDVEQLREQILVRRPVGLAFIAQRVHDATLFELVALPQRQQTVQFLHSRRCRQLRARAGKFSPQGFSRAG